MSTPYIGEIRMFPFGFAPQGWLPCEGQTLTISSNQELFSLLGTMYGGDARTTFALPDLRGAAPLHFGTLAGETLEVGQRGGEETHALTVGEMPAHTHQLLAGGASTTNDPTGAAWGSAPRPAYGPGSSAAMSSSALTTAGGSQPHYNMQPYQVLYFAIAVSGVFPNRDSGSVGGDAYIGEIRPVGFNFAPNGWALCNGQQLPLDQNTALFSILGTTYGGNGTTTFALPDLQARIPVHAGASAPSDPSRSRVVLGEEGGAASVALLPQQLPGHTHAPRAEGAHGDTSSPEGAIWAQAHVGRMEEETYAEGTPTVAMGVPTGVAGAGSRHNNRSPYVALNFIISLQGLYPSRP